MAEITLTASDKKLIGSYMKNSLKNKSIAITIRTSWINKGYITELTSYDATLKNGPLMGVVTKEVVLQLSSDPSKSNYGYNIVTG